METNGDLTVFSASAQSVGVYTCVASNSVGSASGQIEVTVRGMLIPTNLSKTKSEKKTSEKAGFLVQNRNILKNSIKN